MSMTNMMIHCANLEVSLDTGPAVADITPDLQAIVEASGIKQGVLHATIIGSTGSLTTIEFEPGVVEDLKNAVNRLAPPDLNYAHELAWHDGNGHSHVQAALLGPSLSLPVRQGRLRMGQWQEAVALNLDSKARKRMVEITVTGTA